MPDLLRSPWINIAAAVIGGLALGIGLGRIIVGFNIAAVVWTVIGVLMLWWALSDRRRFQRGTPESEVDGSHRTID